jgi:Amt family ammonium transporter
VFLGFVAQLSCNGASNGLLYGNARQLGWQAIAGLAGPVYAFTATFVLLR